MNVIQSETVKTNTTSSIITVIIIWSVIILSLLGITGWIFNISLFKSVHPEWISMRVITAVSLILNALSIWFLRKGVPSGRDRIYVIISSIIPVTAGFSTSLIYLFEKIAGHEAFLIHLPVMNLFFEIDYRMSFIAAVSFVVMGTAFLLMSSEIRLSADISHAIILPVALCSYIIFTGYIFNVGELYLWIHIPPSIQTSLSILLLCLGSFLIKKNTWLMGVIFSAGAGGMAARRLLPGVFIVPLIVGWLRMQGEAAGFYTSSVGVLLVATAYTLVLYLMVWITARSLNRVDSERRAGEELLRLSEERYATTLASIGDAVIATDACGRVTFMNTIAENLTGWTFSESAGRPASDIFNIINEGSRLTVESPISAVLEKGIIIGLANHTLLVRKDGTEIPIDDSGAPILDKNKKIAGVVLIFRDITERKNAESMLRASEEQVRIKLNSILSPEGETGDLELGDIIDVPAIQSLIDNFYKLAKIPMSIIDLKGKVLIGAGWQDICTKFHRVNPVTCRNCIESDLELSADVPAGEYKLYKCKNGMWDMTTPVIVGGRKMGGVFMGQFIFEHEETDFEYFRHQAKQYGFNEEEYISALEKVPRLSAESVDWAKAFFMKLSNMISQLSYSNIRLSRSISQQEILMKSLSDSEKRFRNIFELPKAIMLLIDPYTGMIEDANSAAANFYGWTQDQLRSMKIQDINILSEDEVEAERLKALSEKRNYFNFSHRLADGMVRSVEVYSSAIVIQNKPMLYSVIHDITERKQAEKEILLTADFLHMVNRSSGLPVLLKETAMFFQKHSGCEAVGIRIKKGDDFPYAETAGFPGLFVKEENSILHRENDDIVLNSRTGKPLMNCICGEVISRLHNPQNPYYTPGGSFYTNSSTRLFSRMLDEYRPPRVKGRCINDGYESIALFPLLTGDDLIGLVQLNDKRTGVFTPEQVSLWERLTGHLAIALSKFISEEALKDSEERYATTLASIGDAVIAADYDGKITFMNMAAEKITGWKLAEASGMKSNKVFRIINQETGIEIKSPVETVLNEGATAGTASHRILIRKDGTEIPIDDSGAPIKNRENTIIGAVLIFRDITERRKSEQELKSTLKELDKINNELCRSNRELDDFAYIASHDLREPLRGLHSYSKMLLEDYSEQLDDQGKSMLNTLTKLTGRLDSFILSLLQYSKLGRSSLVCRPFPVYEAVNDAVESLEFSIREKPTRIEISNDLPELYCDRVRLVEIYSNILSNALKYNDKPERFIYIGCIEKSDKNSSSPVLFVKDNGIGIDMKFRDKIFQIFKRLHPRDKFGSGTGAGLTIAKKCVELHGGEIWFESEPGAGTTFYFTLNAERELQ